MSMVPVRRPSVKARSPETVLPIRSGCCTLCRGIGCVNGEPCLNCDGYGRVVEGYRSVDPAMVTTYHAVTLEGIIDEGRRLDAFVAQLRRDWSNSADDIVVIKSEGTLGNARVVAVLRPSVAGLVVSYL